MVATLANLLGTPRFRREVLGVGLVLVALLTASTLGRGGDDGLLVDWWGRSLTASVGWAAPLVPLLIGLVALRSLGSQPGAVLEARHYLGGAAFTVAVVGLLQLGSGLGQPQAGGYLGTAVAAIWQRVLGPVGAGLGLFVIGAAGVLLLAGTDLQTFWADLRALISMIWRLARRLFRAIGRALGMALAVLTTFVGHLAGNADTVTSTDDEMTESPPAPIMAAEAVSILVDSEPAAPATVEKRPSPPAKPVINVVSRQKHAAPNKARAAVVTTTPAAPMPLPDLTRLAQYDDVEPDTGALHDKAKLIEETLASFKVEAWVREINPGPAVTQFALEPGTGTKVRRITELQNDLALALAAPSIRIEAPVPGMARVGLEIPNASIATVGLRETLESAAYERSKAKLPIPLGRDVNGRYVIGDLTKMPHLLIAGATGAGKSVCLNTIISTFLLTRSPEQLRLLMIDPKMVELTGYNGVPHLQCPVVTEMDKVVGALRLTLREMERRYTLFSQLGVRNLDGYKMKMADEPGAEQLPHLVVIIDELADLMMTAPDDVETLLVRLAQMARATGIHLIIATQRPSVDVLTGLIKANIPARIAFAVSSLTDSRVVLDMPGAERLLGRGDMLFLPPDAAKPQRVQGAFVSDADAQYLVEHWHSVAPVPHYASDWLDLPSSNETEDGAGEDDPLFEQALAIVRQQGTASASMLQRRLRVGYNRAARLIERLEDDGVIGPADGIRGRPVLAGDDM
jgi:S-DNA-T family DNA segregation ATPase FtsK/SpoIIIE